MRGGTGKLICLLEKISLTLAQDSHFPLCPVFKNKEEEEASNEHMCVINHPGDC